jgi:P pilus assembly chaperone PapD
MRIMKSPNFDLTVSWENSKIEVRNPSPNVISFTDGIQKSQKQK